MAIQRYFAGNDGLTEFMRRPIIAAAYLAACFATAVEAQTTRSRAFILDDSLRWEVVRSGLERRAEVFPAGAVIDGCSLGQTLGDSGSTQSELQRAFGGGVRGSLNGGGCPSDASILREMPREVIYFRSLKHETDEYVSLQLGGAVPRQAGLVVLDIVVRIPSKSMTRVEQWVLRRARPGVWAVETIRIFGFGYT